MTTPLRIALVSDTYLPEINGVTTVLRTMRDGLRARGHDVLMLAPRYPSPGPDDSGVFRRASIPFPLYPAVRLSLPIGGGASRALHHFRPDLVHVATEGPLGLVGRGWAGRNAVPLVTSFHTDFPRYAGRYLGNWSVRQVRRYCTWFHRPAAITQTPSEETAAELRSFGIQPVMAWGRGVDPDHFTPARRSESRRFALRDRPVVLYVGRLAREKDIGVLVTCFRMLREQWGDRIAFAISGDGPEGEVVRGQLPFARHHGFLDRDRLADLYADSDVFVFPSQTETCGLVALEAMASGVPVIAADRGGVLENLRPGVNGLRVAAGNPAAFADATSALLADTAQRQALAAGARAWAVGHSWQKELDDLERVYRKVIDIIPTSAHVPVEMTIPDLIVGGRLHSRDNGGMA
jgi:glycosyltransferase involved in cell wall biosynthesis